MCQRCEDLRACQEEVKRVSLPGTVGHDCTALTLLISARWEAEVDGSQGQEFETSLTSMEENMNLI
ncbi:hypothetical protein AAY473_022034 [Plecturocebus cupreus]